MNDLSMSSGHEGQRIDLDHDGEIARWTRLLGCTEAELRNAVNAVGSDAAAILVFLSRDN